MAVDTLTQWRVAKETKEFVGPITVTVDDVAVTTFETSLTKGSDRPIVWTAAYVLGTGGSAKRGLLVGHDTDWPLDANATYTVWVRFSSTPEQPVEKVGTLKVF